MEWDQANLVLKRAQSSLFEVVLGIDNVVANTEGKVIRLKVEELLELRGLLTSIEWGLGNIVEEIREMVASLEEERKELQSMEEELLKRDEEATESEKEVSFSASLGLARDAFRPFDV